MVINEENKNQNNIISPPLNLSIKNQKIVESLSPKINIMNKTASEAFHKNSIKASSNINKTIFTRIKNPKPKKPLRFSISSKNIQNIRNFRQKNTKIGMNSKKPNNKANKNSSVENEKITLKIYNNLDKIEETLLEDFKPLMPQKEKEKNNEQYINENKIANNIEEIKKDNYNQKNMNKNNIFSFENKNNDNKYLTVPIKSKTSYNFYPISKSNDKTIELNNINNPKEHKRLKSTEEIRPQHITRYLERKKINDLPVTYPLYLSYNNKYNSISEKNRVDKILNKLICLKTHIMKDPLNRIEIIQEFFLKNGFDKNIYFNEDSINNFYYYLKQPFSFPPEYSLADVIKDGINFKHKKEKEEIIDMNMANFLDYLPKNRKWSEYDEYNSTSKKRNKNSNSIGNEIIYNLLMEEIFKKRYFNYENFKNKTLSALIKDLEYELRQIKIDKMNRLDKYNDLIATRKLNTIKLIDNNKYVPNLCLISKGFKEKCKSVVDKKNRKIIQNMNKQEHLKQINNRLYYDIIRKNNLIEFDRNDIQRKLKLTEYVVMERSKKKLMFQNVKNTITNILKTIKKKNN